MDNNKNPLTKPLNLQPVISEDYPKTIDDRDEENPITGEDPASGADYDLDTEMEQVGLHVKDGLNLNEELQEDEALMDEPV